MDFSRRRALIDDVDISCVVVADVEKPNSETVASQVEHVGRVLEYLGARASVESVTLIGMHRADRVVVRYRDGIRVFPYGTFLNLHELP